MALTGCSSLELLSKAIHWDSWEGLLALSPSPHSLPFFSRFFLPLALFTLRASQVGVLPPGQTALLPHGSPQAHTLPSGSLYLALGSKAAWALCPIPTPPCSAVACLAVREGAPEPHLSLALALCSPSPLCSSLPGPAVCMAHAASGERLTPSDSCGSASRSVSPAAAWVKSCGPGTRSLGLCPERQLWAMLSPVVGVAEAGGGPEDPAAGCPGHPLRNPYVL